MKKVMLISPKDNNFYNFRSELILQLVENDYEVVLVCPYGEKIDYFTERGCRFINLKMDRRGKNIFKDLQLIKSYYSIVKKEKPDVVLTYTGKPSIYAGFVCGILKIPYIVNNAGLMEAKGFFAMFMNFLYKVGFRKASCIMFQNDHEKEVIGKILKNKMYYRRIPGSGVNINEFTYKEYPNSDEVIIFNYVARIVNIKGIEEFLQCAECIKERYDNTKFIIYGDYDDDSYRGVIEEMEKRGIVEYGGVKLDMKPFIEQAHAVIHPSYYEGMTNVVLEHSAMGRVCIGSNIPGVADGIEDGKTGFLFEVKDVSSLLETVKKFIELPHELKTKMGVEARKKMEKEFDRRRVTNIYLDEIRRIIEMEGKGDESIGVAD